MLSGGLDSRLIAATLREMNFDVRTFAVAKPGSADAVVSPLAAAAIGSEHRLVENPAGERIRAISFYAYPSSLWPRESSYGGRAVWSGDGGSGVLGHTNISPAIIELAARDGKAFAQRLYPQLSKKHGIRILRDAVGRGLHGKVTEKIHREVESYTLAYKDRAAFYFDLRNHQFRHLHDYFEEVDIWRIELILPFYDRDFVEIVHRMPIQFFVSHRIYHSIIERLQMYKAGVPWQTYPTQLPCPFPMPPDTRDQWTLASTFHAEPGAHFREWFHRLLRLDIQGMTSELNRAYLSAMKFGSWLGVFRLPHAARLAFRIVFLAGRAPAPKLTSDIIGNVRITDFPAATEKA